MTSAADHDLHRTLWRYRAGWLPESRLTGAIAERLKHLAMRVGTLEGRSSWLRKLPGDAWRAQDEARSSALRALGWRDFETCTRLLHTAERLVDELAASVAAEEALSAADAAWERFVGGLHLDDLADCPTLRIPRRLGRLSRELLRHGEARSAMRVGAIRDATCAALRVEAFEVTELSEERQRLEAIRRHSPERGRRLDELRRRGFAALASRLADDLEAELASQTVAGYTPSAMKAMAERASAIRRHILDTCRPLEE